MIKQQNMVLTNDQALAIGGRLGRAAARRLHVPQHWGNAAGRLGAQVAANKLGAAVRRVAGFKKGGVVVVRVPAARGGARKRRPRRA